MQASAAERSVGKLVLQVGRIAASPVAKEDVWSPL